jgi:hypothetical protein
MAGSPLRRKTPADLTESHASTRTIPVPEHIATAQMNTNHPLPCILASRTAAKKKVA